MAHTSNQSAVRIRGLSAGHARYTVLHQVTAELPRAKVTAIVGPNGSGKSTLLGVLAGVIAPAAGDVEIGTRRPAFVVQHSAVPAGLPMTVWETVAMGRWAHRGRWRSLSKKDKILVASCLERMGIDDLAQRRLSSLSGGQRQRALLAQAFAQESDLLLLDEPDAGLDAQARHDISAAITHASAGGVTVVCVTHDLDAASKADHCLLLQDGRLVAEGGPRDVLAIDADRRLRHGGASGGIVATEV
ncbi:zinc ABC transporter ATP-binding protein AztA [Lentzea sp. NEAU-D7]|uniref:zinc ABC transporter ATP-binding protein AztA n=1 Tax=Lentzea sp. NEAU-D7 TaxID=2994667 RepID=UPI00224AB21C|nr:zinc ABC transporter ATP-binding protein AztA [Lentzea sp. NEAU-D7]MCX2948806.1 zinc ABC transporter ATP-binding protein AztA [Lentzea sp. NEAU-D7]